MIIQLAGSSDDDIAAERRALADLTEAWGQRWTEVADAAPGGAPKDRNADGGEKAVDPIAVSALVLSLPSAALAVLDLADRLRKRRRAEDLIEQARQAEARRVTIRLLADRQYLRLASLTPDELLELLDAENPGS